MTRPRAADDFAAIQARMEELQRERAPITAGRTADATLESYRRPISRNPAPIDEGDIPSRDPHRR